MPSLGDSFPIIAAAGGILDTFSTGIFPSLGDGLAFDLNYSGTTLALDVISTSGNGDIDGDGVIGGDDADDLVAGIASGSSDLTFDLTGDGLVDIADLDQWLVVAGAANLPSGNPYLYGDASLDGVVDVSDFNAWNSNKFTATAAWTMGDFNADGVIDASDFNRWNGNKFLSSDAPSMVPEPSTGTLLLFALTLIFAQQRRVR